MANINLKRLIKTNTIWLPQIPEYWELIKVRHLFKESTKKGFPNETLLVASQEHGVVSKDVYGKRTVEATKDLHNLKLVEQGDFVISLRSFQGGIEVAHERGIISPAYTIMKATMQIEKRYFKNLFKSPPFISLMTLCVKGIREGQNIDYPTFKNEFLPFPPLEEQKAIAEYLDKKNNEIDKFIRNKERLIELLEEHRKEMIDVGLSTFENIVTNKKPLKYLVRLVSDLTTKLGQDETYLALENIESWTGKIDLSIGQCEFESTVKKFKNTDVLFSKLRPYLAKVVIPNFNGVCVSEILVLRPSNLVDKEFLFYNLIRRRFIDYVDTSTYGSKMPRASYDFIGKIEIEYPIEINKQKSIVQEIKQKEFQIEVLKNKYSKEISSIKEYREALITDLITGKRSIPQ